MPNKVCDEITFPFPNFDVSTFHRELYSGCYYLSSLGFKLIHVSESTTLLDIN